MFDKMFATNFATSATNSIATNSSIIDSYISKNSTTMAYADTNCHTRILNATYFMNAAATNQATPASRQNQSASHAMQLQMPTASTATTNICHRTVGNYNAARDYSDKWELVNKSSTWWNSQQALVRSKPFDMAKFIGTATARKEKTPNEAAEIGKVYEGSLKSFNLKKGFGFLISEFERDVFLHKDQLVQISYSETNPAEVGTQFRFTIVRNARGQLQARNLAVVVAEKTSKGIVRVC